jgi:LCP family protein required for cell wall assembly
VHPTGRYADAPMADHLRRTWPQRLTFVFVLLTAIACFATAGVLAFGQWVLSQRNLVVVQESTQQFTPEANQTPVVMPGDTTTTTVAGEVAEPTTTTTIPLAEPDAANFLVTGADNGACLDQTDLTIGDRGSIGERSDTIMVWRVNPVANQLAVLSFPRDLLVDLPGGRKGRINEAYRKNDPSRLIDTIQLNFGVPVDHYIQIDFCAFKRLVDAVDGVEIPFEVPAYDRSSGLVIETAGCVRLDGDMALAYARSRHYYYEDPPGSGEFREDPTADFGRIARQQDFLRRVISKIVSEGLYSPSVASALIDANAQYFVTDAELTPRRMLEFAATLRNLDPTTVTTYRIESSSENYSGQSVQRPRIDGDNMRAILAVFRGEATIGSAPEQVVEGSDDGTGDETTTVTTAPPDASGDESGDEATGDASATTVPSVQAEENVLGVVPPRDVTCN